MTKEIEINKKDRFEMRLEDLSRKLDKIMDGMKITDKKIDRISEKLTIRQNTIEKKVDNLVQEHLH